MTLKILLLIMTKTTLKSKKLLTLNLLYQKENLLNKEGEITLKVIIRKIND